MPFPLLKRCLSEFVGTFFLVLIGPGAAVVDQVSGGMLGNLGIAIAFGLVVFLMIFWLGRISGAHINPAVSIALTLSGHLEWAALLPYLASQFTGGIAGAFALKAIWPDAGTYGPTVLSCSLTDGILFELTISAILMASIYWAISTEGRRKWVSVIVGATVGLLAYLIGPETGASMNPARTLGPAIASNLYDHLWVYLLVTTAGMIAVGLFFRIRYGRFVQG